MLKTTISFIKNKYKKLPIGKKITYIYSSVFMLMIVLFSIFAFSNIWIYYTSISKTEINTAANKVEEYVKSGNKLEKNKLEEIIDNPYIDVKIFNRNLMPNGNIETMPNPDLFPNPENFSIEKNSENKPKKNDMYGKNSIDDNQYIYMHRVFEYNNNTYEILIFRRNNTENMAITISFLIIIFTNIFSILIAIFVGKYITKKILAPIREITDTAEKISLYDLSKKIEVPNSDDEIKMLVLRFNSMIERLQESFNKENQFISDASHELKTPIAIINGYINMMDRWGKNEPEVLEEAISSIKSETEHMKKLIEQLLYLAKNTQDENDITFENTSLNFIANEIVKELEIINPEIETKILFPPNEISVKSNQHLLKQMLWIFIENSIKYKKDDKLKIEIEIGTICYKPFISVKDNGIGIEENEINKIFDRFYRQDKSRNKKIEGNGLGLSIALAISQKLNVKIKVDSKINEGSSFKIIFNN